MRVIKSKTRAKQPVKRKSTAVVKKPARKDFVADKISSVAELPADLGISDIYFTNFSDDDSTIVDHAVSVSLLTTKEEADQAVQFDSIWYLSTYPDVREAGIEPLEHFLQHGMREGRNPNSAFDGENYVRANPDIALFPYGPFMHYICFGYSEKRPLR